MLVLSRKENQKIHIGNDISVMVVKARDGSVRLGIEAPKDVEVHREEIYEQKQGDSAYQTVKDGEVQRGNGTTHGKAE